MNKKIHLSITGLFFAIYLLIALILCFFYNSLDFILLMLPSLIIVLIYLTIILIIISFKGKNNPILRIFPKTELEKELKDEREEEFEDSFEGFRNLFSEEKLTEVKQ